MEPLTYKQHVTNKIRKHLNLLNIEPAFKVRVRDLTSFTDDPGNTGITILLVTPLNDEVDEALLNRSQILKLLGEDEGKGGPGDCEEFILFAQNNELGILINFNQ